VNADPADRTLTEPRPARAERLRESWFFRRWLVTRGLTVFLLVPQVFEVFGDVVHYFHGVDALLRGGPVAGVLPEYPAPALVVFGLPRLLTGDHLVLYVPAFMMLILAIDAAFSRVLWRATGWRSPDDGRPPAGLTLWLWLPPALGPLTVCRLDLVPAVLAGGALLAVTRRPALAGTLAALGAAVKLWPAVLVPALGLRRAGRWRLLAAFAVTGGVVCLAVLALVGSDRLASPLTWQSDRSLQLESFAALPLLVAGAVSPGTWRVDYTRFFAFEVTGPGVSTMLTVAGAATLAAAVGLAGLWLRAARRRDTGPLAIGWLAVATVTLVIITDKTLSPQYLLWLGALLAVLGVTGRDGALPRATRLLLAGCLLTQLLYPTMYGLLIDINPVPVAILVARDVLLAQLGWLAVRRFWALTGATRADDPGVNDPGVNDPGATAPGAGSAAARPEATA